MIIKNLLCFHLIIACSTALTMSYNRPSSTFRQILGGSKFPYEPSRYILYVSHACPWANGALQVATLKGLVKKEGESSSAPLQLCVVHPTWQYTKPVEDRLAFEQRQQREGGAGRVTWGDAKVTDYRHAGWFFGKPGTSYLPVTLMHNARDIGLDVTGGGTPTTSLDEILEGTISSSALESHGITSPHCTEDASRYGAKNLRELYEKAAETMGDTGTTFRPTTPMILDTVTGHIVNNESTEILQFLDAWPSSSTTDKEEIKFYPLHLKDEVLSKIDWVYTINNGVYRCGFSKDQKAYETATEALEQRMEEVQAHLEKNLEEGYPFLVRGHKEITAADIRLFNTLVRMDEVYVAYFKCGFASLLQPKYRGLLEYTARVWHSCGGFLKDCVFMDEIQKHYFTSHMARNTYAIIPKRIEFLQMLEDMKQED